MNLPRNVLSTVVPVSLLLALCRPVAAQVPTVLDFQSSVSVAGTNYAGWADFKFALLDEQAAVTFWSNDGTSVGGNEPRDSVSLVVENGLYQVALGDPSYGNMKPVSPSIFTNAHVRVRVWFSSDQKSFHRVVPDQPIAAVGYAMIAARVPDGSVATAQLAAGAVTADKLAASAVTTGSIAPGAVGGAELAPDAALQNLQKSGGLWLSDQPNATNLQRAGYRRIGTVQSDSERWLTNSNFVASPRGNHAAIWTGTEMLVFGGDSTALSFPPTEAAVSYDPHVDAWTALDVPRIIAGTGMVGVWTGQEAILLASSPNFHGAYNPATRTWRSLTNFNAPKLTQTAGITVAWTGREVLVWGGSNLAAARHLYNPTTDMWRLVSTTNRPPPAEGQSAIWTGSELIVWGGTLSGGAKGARYDPTTDFWTPISEPPIPLRLGHSVVWTGNRMIVWGGQISQAGATTQTGASYDPSTDKWTVLSGNAAPTARAYHVAAWTGKEMVIWGGTSNANRSTWAYLHDGARYQALTDTWSPMSPAPSAAMAGQSATWTGQELILWGGGELSSKSGPPSADPQRPLSNIGWRYRPVTDDWRPTAYAPTGRSGHTAIWTGSEFIIWGGSRSLIAQILEPIGSDLLNTGGRFDPKTGRWVPLSTVDAPTARVNHEGIWTGTDMIIWGGQGISAQSRSAVDVRFLNTGARYNPQTDKWTAMDTNAAPAARTDFTLTWTGSAAVIFGGRGSATGLRPGGWLNSGASYDPANDSWSSIRIEGAPAPRHLHTAVWTGHEMLVWGGEGSILQRTNGPSLLLNTGARYDPIANTWSSLSTNNAPSGRTSHLAVWTGSRMIIWGGESMSYRNGALYDPNLNRWAPLSSNLAPPASSGQAAVWTGEEMIVWGNENLSLLGGRYNPTTDAWAQITQVGAPPGRTAHQAAWTGTEMLIFGGRDSRRYLFNNVLRYQLTVPLYLYRHD